PIASQLVLESWPASSRMPASFLPSASTSLGHLTEIVADGAKQEAVSATANAATKDSCASVAGGIPGLNSRVAARLPWPVSHARALRPRPAVWRAALIHSGPASPFSATRRASLLVESSSSYRTLPAGQEIKGAALSRRHRR